MKKNSVKITPKEFNEYVLNFQTNENEFRGKVLLWSITVEELIGEIITKHFVNKSQKIKFSRIVVPRIAFSRKIEILKDLFDLDEYSEIKSKHTKIIKNLETIKDYRNKVAHKNSDLFENMVNSRDGKKDITIIKYKDGEVKPEIITEKEQESIIKFIRKCISDLRIISVSMQIR